MIKNIKLLETDNAVHYECLVNKWICTKCTDTREYERQREQCLICENKLEFVEEQKFGWINKNSEKWGCSCIFGSWYRWGGFWLNNYPETKCRHYKQAFRKWQKEKRIRAKQIQNTTKIKKLNL